MASLTRGTHGCDIGKVSVVRNLGWHELSDERQHNALAGQPGSQDQNPGRLDYEGKCDTLHTTMI